MRTFITLNFLTFSTKNKPFAKALVLFMCMFFCQQNLLAKTNAGSWNEGLKNAVSVTANQNIFIDHSINPCNLNMLHSEATFQLISHGRSGELLLNGKWCNAQEIAKFMQPKLHNSQFIIHNLNIYGCEFAKGEKGLQAVTYLEKTLAVSVSASTNITGKDGDWVLEVGKAKDVIALNNYNGNLAWTLSDTCATCDFDGDGVLNNIDIDDDNDGILDAVEAPNCYSTAAEMAIPSAVATAITGAGATTNLFDNVSTTTFAFPTTSAASALGKSILELTPASSQIANSIILNLNSVTSPIGAISASATVKAQGWNGSTWVDLATYTASPAINTINVQTFAFSNTTAYSKYRLFESGTLGNGVIIGTNAIQDVSLGIPLTYSPSLNRKPTCTTDPDGDGFTNNFDLDSDGDGCADAKETGVTGTLNSSTTGGGIAASTANAIAAGPYGANGLANTIETSDLSNAVTNYYSVYGNATSATIKGCLDTDLDGVADVFDLDDDNDGVLDAVECGLNQNVQDISSTVASTGSTNLNVGNIVPSGQIRVRVWNNVAPSLLTANVSGNDFAFNAWSYKEELPHLPASNEPFSSEYYTNTFPTAPTLNIPGYTGLEYSFWLQPGTYSFCGLWDDGHSLAYSTTGNQQDMKLFSEGTWTTNISNSPVTITTPTLFQFRSTDVSNILQPTEDFGISVNGGACTKGLNLSTLPPSYSCTTDTDGDGIPNSLDLDSDGDGCPDAKEAGVTGTLNNSIVGFGMAANVANAIAAGPYGINGLANAIESSDTRTATTTYTPTYSPNALTKVLNACADTDGDGIPDLVDIDDDNDGTLDALEAPNCYYTAAEANVISSVSSQFTSSSAGGFATLIDGNSATKTFKFDAVVANNVLPGSNLFTLTYPNPVNLSSLSISDIITATGSSTADVYGSIDGTTWTKLTTSPVAITAAATFPIPAAVTTEYKYYKVQLTAPATGAALATTNAIGEITSVVNTNFVPSSHPKPTCTTDTDGDGITNDKDLDSDGDGCPDAKEAGVTAPLLVAPANRGVATGTANAIIAGSFGNNGLSNTLENNDLFSATTSYVSTYNAYATVVTINACTDTDGDGIPDVIDLDDDNDGILDTDEMNCVSNPPSCTTNILERATIAPGVILSNQLALNYGMVFGLDQTFSAGVITSNTCGAISIGQDATIWDNTFSVKFVNPIDGVTPQALNSFTVKTDCAATNEIYSWDAYDINGNFLYNQALPSSGSLQCLTITPAASNVYSVRIHQTSSAATIYGITFATPCQDKDTDGDGIPDRLDLDSDGDGCPDSKEGGNALNPTITSTMPGGNTGSNYNGTTSSPVVLNLCNSSACVSNAAATLGVPTAAVSGQSVGYSENKAFNFCIDSDGDGIPDVKDLDDDNDGILDAVESPSCFYSAAEMAIPSVVKTGFALTAGTIANVYDNNTSTSITFVQTAYSDGINKTVFEVTPTVPIVATSIILKTSLASTTPIGTVDNTSILTAQGWNGTAWVDILTYTASPAVSGNLQTFAFPSNTTAYQKYRLFEPAGSAGVRVYSSSSITEVALGLPATYNPSANPKPTCTGSDLDGDGIPNYLDLDSDGDGCSDAKEAGVAGLATTTVAPAGMGATTGLANSVAPAPYSGNGFSDVLQTSLPGDTNTYKGYYTYQYATSKVYNVCSDVDADGVNDIADIDADNDGILDAVECPSCYYTAAEANVISTITTDLTNDTYAAGATDMLILHDGSTAASVTYNVATALTGKSIATVTYPTPVKLADLTVNVGATFVGTTPTSKLQGSKDGFTWFNLTATPAADKTLAAGAQTFTVTQNADNYMYYRVTGTSGTSSTSGTITEITSNIAPNYCASLNPKTTCTTDTDGDGITNDKDLDSDGDGCPDAVESGTNIIAGATTSTAYAGAGLATGTTKSVINGPYGGNGFADVLQTSFPGDTNSYKGTYAYNTYATVASINACLDTDGDGIPDVFDLDDDNDGVLDTEEEFCSASDCTTMYDRRVIWNSLCSLCNSISGTYIGANSGLVNVTATTDKSFYLIRDAAFNSNATCPDGVAVVSKSAINYYTGATTGITAPYNVTYTFDKPVVNPSLVFSSNQGSVINFPTPVYLNSPGTGGGTAGSMITTLPACECDQSVIFPGIYTSISFSVPNIEQQMAIMLYLDDVVPNGTPTQVLSTLSSFCIDLDTDGDGIPNRLDLDSDGDGCPDAKEAGVSALAGISMNNAPAGMGVVTGTTNAVAPSPYGANGFSNFVETSAESGIYKGVYTYKPLALSKTLNACTDTDGDGIPDLIDLDDDNDGILDAVECPSCYYTAAAVSSIYATGTDLNWGINYPIIYATDGDITSHTQTTGPGQAITNQTVIEFSDSIGAFLPISSLNLNMTGGGLSNAAADGAMFLQGWDGLNWVNLSTNVTNATATTTVVFNNTLQPNGLFSKYRVRGFSGNAGWAYIGEASITLGNTFTSSAYPKPSCTTDTDGDGITNDKDLDSDGDGCSDAKEAGVTSFATTTAAPAGMGATTGLANAVAPAPYSGNGFSDALQTSLPGDTNTYKGFYTYQYATSKVYNACSDVDGDGVNDIADIDADNDGILDAVECPSCYYTAAEANVISTVTSDLANDTYATGATDMLILHDGLPAPIVTYTTGTAITGKSVATVTYPTPVKLDTLTVNIGTSFGTLDTAKLQGSNDGFTWFDLSTKQALTATKSFKVTQNANNYLYYKVVGTSGTIAASASIKEITSVLAPNYCASLNPKLTCTTDTDGDGITNDKDLDSDGDGCPDAVESGTNIIVGATTSTAYAGAGLATGTAKSVINGPYGGNGFADILQTSFPGDTNSYKGTYAYNTYATVASINACLDTDSDGIPDVFDLDDDNDGVLDVNEMSSFCTLQAATPPTWKINVWSGYNGYSAASLTNYTAVPVTTFGSVVGTASLTGANIDMNAGLSTNAVTALATAGVNNFVGTNDLDRYMFEFVYVVPSYYAGNLTLNITNTSSLADAFTVFKNSNILYNAYYGATPTTPAFNNLNFVAGDTIRMYLGEGANGNTWLHTQLVYSDTCANKYLDRDTDGDGIPDRLDLDSDGDGCPDAKEAGVSSLAGISMSNAPANMGAVTGTANAVAPSPYGANGFSDFVETSTESGVYKGIYTYNQYALNKNINLCDDCDGDGIPNVFDLDDDNDGILDAVECPSCYSTQTASKSIYAVSTDLTYDGTTSNLKMLFDSVATANFNFSTVQTLAGKNIFTLTMPTPVQLDTVKISQAITGTGTANLYGSTDGITFVKLTSPDVNINATPTNFVVNQNTGFYKYYKVQGVTGSTVIANKIGEITTGVTAAHAAQYPVSLYPLPTGCPLNSTNDKDGDGVLNSCDLDSDGDGCSDAQESGVAGTLLTGTLVNKFVSAPHANSIAQGPYGANGFADPLQKAAAVDSNAYNTPTYPAYTYSIALDSTTASCTKVTSQPDKGTISSAVGGVVIANIASNDSIYGIPATVGTNGSATISKSGTWPAGITLDSLTGAVSVAKGTTPATYLIQYTICDKSLPKQCVTKVDTVIVTPLIKPKYDSLTVSSNGGGATPNIALGDSVNGRAATIGAGGNATISKSGTWPTGITLDSTTGLITVAKGTKPGKYAVPYNLCDTLNPKNCAVMVDTVWVTPYIKPKFDSLTVTSNGGGAIPNIALGDSVNGKAAVIGAGGNATISKSGTWPTGITLDSLTGLVTVAKGTTPGKYAIPYNLCDTLNPKNCAVMVDTVWVTSYIKPKYDSLTVSSNGGGAIPNIALGDSVNGKAAVIGAGGNATIATSGTWPTGITLNTTTGLVTVAKGTTPGKYAIPYNLCDTLTPKNCAIMVDTIWVTPYIKPKYDSLTVSSAGGGASPNIAQGDSVNGLPATIGTGGNATISKSGTWPTGFTLDTLTGNIVVPNGTIPGKYPVPYNLCDKLTPQTCAVMVDTVFVTPLISAKPDTGTIVIAGGGGVVIANIASNDSVDGLSATLGTGGNATLTPIGTWPAGITVDSLGKVKIATTVPLGTYSVNYRLCNKSVQYPYCVTTTVFLRVRSNPLPVELLSFEAKLNESNTVSLEWKTATEINNNRFEVERSTDAKNFTVIGVEKTQATDGNSTEILSYTLLDKTPENGINYYRLHQFDNDGTNTYSAIQSVEIQSVLEQINITVYPNPTANVLYFNSNNLPEIERIFIVDLHGKEVGEKRLEGTENYLNMADLPASEYEVVFQLKNGKKISKKILKN